MIRGEVTADYEAVIQLLVYGPTGQSRCIKAVLDTGFNAYLTLPTSIVAELGLSYHGMAVAVLADGTRVALRKYEATVTWDDRQRDILVLDGEGVPLIGMSMLRGHSLVAEVVVGGSLRIEPIR